MKTKKLFFIPAAIIWLLCCTCIVQAAPYPPLDEALAALESDNAVTVVEQKIIPWFRPLYVFEPATIIPTKGFIFYPGAFIDPRSYAPAMHRLAALGYLAVIVPMPGNLAVFGKMRASRVIRNYDEIIETWAIGGHGIGGDMACKYAQLDLRRAIKGVVLWAAAPSLYSTISFKNIKALSIYGNKDGITKLKKIGTSVKYLPDNATLVNIVGGNHTQFGYYGDGGPQKGDNLADMSLEEQQDRVVDATAAFLGDL